MDTIPLFAGGGASAKTVGFARLFADALIAVAIRQQEGEVERMFDETTWRQQTVGEASHRSVEESD